MKKDTRNKDRTGAKRSVSSLLTEWGTPLVFSAIIALAVCSLFLRADDMAHTPVVIGVSAFDSVRAASSLDHFAEFCRGKGCGDIRWRYLGPERAVGQCDFYLMTSLDLSARLAGGDLGCALIAAEREAHRYSRSSVLVREGVTALPARGARIIFGSPRSAAGYLGPWRALERSGCVLSDATIDFAGSYPGDERVIFGVLFGAYDAGGISLERLNALKGAGLVWESEIDVLIEGDALPEIVLAYDPVLYTADRKSFARRLPAMLEQAPQSLRNELAELGISGFYIPRESDIDLLEELNTMLPPAAAVAPPGEAGDGPRESTR